MRGSAKPPCCCFVQSFCVLFELTIVTVSVSVFKTAALEARRKPTLHTHSRHTFVPPLCFACVLPRPN